MGGERGFRESVISHFSSVNFPWIRELANFFPWIRDTEIFRDPWNSKNLFRETWFGEKPTVNPWYRIFRDPWNSKNLFYETWFGRILTANQRLPRTEILLYSYLNPDVQSIIHKPSVSLSRHVSKNNSLSERSQSSAETWLRPKVAMETPIQRDTDTFSLWCQLHWRNH